MSNYSAFGAIDRTYSVVYADPPWHYPNVAQNTNKAIRHYPTMTVPDMAAAFDLPRILTKKAGVFLWTTGPRIADAIDLLGRWGLHYRGVAWVWVKTCRNDPKRVIRSGVLPTFTKPQTEFVLAATTHRNGRPWPLKTIKIEQVVMLPRLRHSEKPARFRELIEELTDAPERLEMFARTAPQGWDTFGNEIS